MSEINNQKFVFSGKVTTLEALAERESIYKLLPQCTPENTAKDFASYTVDPRTRYPNLTAKLLSPHQVTHLYDTGKTLSFSRDFYNLILQLFMSCVKVE